MRKSTLFRWIAQAEARSVRDLALVQRALSEPHVAIVPAAAKASRFDGLRKLSWRPGNAIAGLPSFAVDGSMTADAGSDALEEGSCGEEEPDRVIVTLLITDIVGSTKRVAEMGDRAWHVLLDRHDDITRREIEQFRGKEVKNRGDGFLAVFDSPTRAVRCAAAIAEAIAPLGISLRSGLHTGEIQLNCSEIGGIAVHIAARIAAIAEPGEALVSSTVRDLVTGSRLLFEDRGSHLLRGVPEEIHLYAMPAAREAANARIISLSQLRRA